MKLNFKIVKGDIEKKLKDHKMNERYIKMLLTPKFNPTMTGQTKE